jgi:hypothetical protein
MALDAENENGVVVRQVMMTSVGQVILSISATILGLISLLT